MCVLCWPQTTAFTTKQLDVLKLARDETREQFLKITHYSFPELCIVDLSALRMIYFSWRLVDLFWNGDGTGSAQGAPAATARAMEIDQEFSRKNEISFDSFFGILRIVMEPTLKDIDCSWRLRGEAALQSWTFSKVKSRLYTDLLRGKIGQLQSACNQNAPIRTNNWHHFMKI